MRSPGFVVLALVISACGSRSDVRKPERPTPALFASIPVDTPYLIAGFEPIPFEAFATMWRAVEPVIGESIDGLMRTGGTSPVDRVLESVIREMDGKWNAAGLESLGLSARPRFAFYGLGYQPSILRVEIKDAAAVLATLGRIAARADVHLPPTESHDGRSFWRFPSGEREIVVALLDQQLIVGYGTHVGLERSMSLILGSKKPDRSMANDTVLADVMVRHRFDPYAIALIDTKRAANAYLAHVGLVPSAACTSEIERMAARVPRFVAAYNISAKRHSVILAVELAADLVAKLEALKVDVPLLNATLEARPFATFGGGIDLPNAQKAGLAMGTSLEQMGMACGWPALRESGTGLSTQMSRTLPAPFQALRGGFATMLTMSHEEPIPLTLEGYAVVNATSMQPLYDFLMTLEVFAKLGITADGAWHSFGDKLPLKLPYELSAAVGRRSLVVVAGAQSKDLATAVIDAPPGAKVPFLISRYDYGRWLELKSRRAVSAESDMQRSLARVFGDAEMILDVEKTGLRFEFGYELK